MTPVDQEFLADEGEVGDCVRAATASILDLPREKVPHFLKDQPGYEWYDTWESFIRSHGYEPIMIHGPWEKVPTPLGFYLASGYSPRGFRHMVVMRDGVVAHDPHPSREGLAEIEAIWIMGNR